jgi:diadenosine tetraphosphate (Ap4A) HIT family hydrolase
MNENNKPFVNLNNARFDEQRRVMEDIKNNKECPFCPENLSKYHKEEILRKGAHWILTRNQWPYKYTDPHLLAIATYHAEKISDLRDGSFDELQDHIVWAEREFKIITGGLAMRFGDMSRNGATVNHLHMHLIVPSIDKPEDQKINFKIS